MLPLRHDSLDFSDQFCLISYVFIITLLSVTFNVFYQVDFEEEISSTTRFSFVYSYILWAG